MSGPNNAAGAWVVLLATVLAKASAAPPPLHAESDADARFSAVEHAYVVYSLGRFPVMATYLGGSAFDPSLADVDGKLRDNSPAAILAEDQQLRALRTQPCRALYRGLALLMT